MAQIEPVEYQELSPQSFTLEVKTDNTGNNAIEECAWFDWISYSFGMGPGYELGYKVSNGGISAKGDISGPHDVYNMHFDEYNKLVTIADDGYPDFLLDTPGTDGIKAC